MTKLQHNDLHCDACEAQADALTKEATDLLRKASTDPDSRRAQLLSRKAYRLLSMAEKILDTALDF